MMCSIIMKSYIVPVLAAVLLIFSVACGQQKTALPVSSSETPALPAIPNCRQAELVSETITPGSQYQAGEKFDKTWVIRNTSPCEWSYSYSLVYYDGIGMGASASRVFTKRNLQNRLLTLTLISRHPLDVRDEIEKPLTGRLRPHRLTDLLFAGQCGGGV